MIRNSSIKSLLDRHGRDLSFTRKGAATYDVRDSELSRSSSVTVTVRGYFYNFWIKENFYDTQSVGERVLVVNSKDTSGNDILKPFSGDTFTGQGNTVTIKDSSEVVEGSSILFYICRLLE